MLGRGFPCIPIKDHFLLLMTQRSKLFPKSPSIVRPSQFHFQLLRSLDRISFFLRRFILLFDSSEKQWPRRPLPIVAHLFLAPSHRDEKSVHKEYPSEQDERRRKRKPSPSDVDIRLCLPDFSQHRSSKCWVLACKGTLKHVARESEVHTFEVGSNTVQSRGAIVQHGNELDGTDIILVCSKTAVRRCDLARKVSGA